MAGSVIYYKKKFHTTGSGQIVGLSPKDPYWNLVGLLLRSKAGVASGSQNNTFVDSSVNNAVVTRFGNATQGSFSPYGAVGGSMYFDGTGDYLTIPTTTDYDFGTGDFTIECWANWSDLTGYHSLIHKPNNATNGEGSFCITSQNSLIQFLATTSPSSGWDIINVAAGVLTLNTWYHIAFVRQGTSLKGYLNGVQVASATSSLAPIANVNPLRIGGFAVGGGALIYPMNGYISDMRIVKGTAIYTASFTPPTAPLSAVTNTKLLLSGTNAAIVDYAAKNDFETVGNAQTSSAITKYGSTSLYFDGAGDKLELTTNPSQWSLGTGDFTIEFWVYPTSTSATYSYLGFTSTSYTGFEVQGTTSWMLNMSSNGSNWDISNGITIGTVDTYNWQHIAVCRSGTQIRLFKNGILQNTIAIAATTAPLANTTGLAIWGRIGQIPNAAPGYMDDIRITKGVARYLTDFAVDIQLPADPYAASSVSLVTTGVNNASNNTLLDSSINNFAITRFGDVAQGTFSPFSNSGFSAYFDGTNSYINTNLSSVLNLGSTSQAWTVEFLIFVTPYSGVSGYGKFIFETAGGGYAQGLFVDPTAGSLGLYQYGNADTNGKYSIPMSKWVHVAVVHDTSISKTKLYIDGQLTYTYNVNNLSNAGFRIGASAYGGSSEFFNGSLRNFRVSDNQRYSGNSFVAPNSDFILDANTKLLVFQNTNNFKDISASNLALSVSGNCKIQPFTNNTSTYSPSVNGGSLYFDGAGDYLDLPLQNALLLGSNNFTFEAWVYPKVSADNTIVSWNGNAVSGYYALHVRILASGALTMVASQLGTAWNLNISSGAGSLLLNTWSHVAIVRNGTAFNAYVNGVSVISTTLSGALMSSGITQNSISRYGSSQFIFNGYLSDIRLLNGTALYTTAFTPPTAPLTAVANTQLLLNGTNAAVYDASGKVNIETIGTAKVSTAVKKYSSSMVFDGTASGKLVIPDSQLWNFGTGDFTIEFWSYLNSIATAVIFVGKEAGGVGGPTVQSGGLYISSNGSSWDIASAVSTGTWAIGAWSHFALSRNGSTFRVFRDGIQVSTFTSSASIYYNPAHSVYLGNNSLSGYPMNGYVEDFRVTKGIARYTSNFTVPATTLGAVVKQLPALAGGAADVTAVETSGGDPYYNNVICLMHMEGVNGSTNLSDQKSHIITLGGAAKLVTSQSKFGSSSAYLSSGSDYVNFAVTTDFLFNDDFTIECWQKFVTGTDGSLFVVSNSSTYLAINSTGSAFNIYINSGTSVATVGVVTTAWQHVALVRKNGVINFYVDGTSVWTTTNSSVLGYSSPSIARLGGGGSAKYIDELRITKGVGRYTSNFSVPTASFPNYQDFTTDSYLNQSVLLKALVNNGQNNTFVDSSVNNAVVTRNGNVSQGTFSPYSKGGSMYFDGTGDYLTIPYNAANTLPTGDFTLECWFNTSSVSGNPIFFGRNNSSVATSDYDMRLVGNLPTCSIYYGGTYFTLTSSVVVTTNQWYHFAVCRVGNVFTMYLNGVSVATTTVAATLQTPNVPLTIGASVNAVNLYTGYLSDIRIVKGTAFYTAAFTPPTVPLTPVTNTQLLLSGTNASIVDAVGKVNIETVGDAKTDLVNRKYSGSLKFDGTGDYLTLTSSSALAFGTGDFTIEAWVYLNSLAPAYQGIFDTRPSGSAGYPLLYITGATPAFCGTNANNIIGSAIVINQWYHLAVSRANGITRLFTNGIQVGSSYTDANNYLVGATPKVGSTFDNYPLNGFIEDLRITKGVARYVGNFTVPLASLPAI